MKKPFLNVVVLCLLSPAVAAMAQTVAHSFDGDTGPGETVCKTGVTHCAWPDMNAGVNGKQVVEVTWQNVRVYDYSCHLQRSTPMTTFIRNAGLNPIPPQNQKNGRAIGARTIRGVSATAALKTARAIEGPWASVTPRPRVRSGVRRAKPFRCQDSTRSVAARCEGLFCLA